jgi:hypothetical protein
MENTMQRRTFLQSVALGTGAMYCSPAMAAENNEKSVISIHLQGGISAVDFINPIPDSTIEFRSSRGVVDAGGFQIGGDFTNIATLGDNMTVVRSMKFRDANHQTATMAHLTSHFHVPNNGQKEPSFGSLVAKQYQPNSKKSGIPHYVKLRNIDGDDSSWLGIRYNGYDADDEGVKNMKLHGNVDARRFDHRLKMMSMIDHAGALPGLGEDWTDLKSMAVNIIKGDAAEAFDLTQEPDSIYGTSRFGKDLLLARRLVERGTKYVSLNSNAGWDNHTGIDAAFANNAPGLDIGVATLVRDLKDRGLLDNTIVVLWSEFSRTKINLNGGRDHNPNTNTLVFFGKEGKGVIGETSDNGLISMGDIHSPTDLAWTIGSHMGLEKGLTIKDNQARPRHIFKQDARDILA